MKTKFSIIILILLMLLSSASISFVSSSNIKTNVMSTKFVAPIKPTVNIIYPEQGSSLLGEDHRIVVSATSANGIKAVELKIDGSESSTGWVEITTNQNSEGQYFYDWTVSVGGDYSITARATNTANKKTEDVISVTVVTEPAEPVHDVAVTSVSASPTSVEIGTDVLVSVFVENQGGFEEVFEVTAYADSNEIGTRTAGLLGVVDSIQLDFEWDTTGVAADEYTISAEISIISEDIEPADNSLTDGIVTVYDLGQLPVVTYEIFVEIDYMEGHRPTDSVLAYITTYFAEKDISVIFAVDDVVPYDSRVSDRDFSRLESTYNDNDFGYYSEYKWVLFGTTVFRQNNVIGYTYVQIVGGDLLAGNYIFIADGTADSWSQYYGLSPAGAEAAVLMHELGHSIGIAELTSSGYELYCTEPACVMAMLNTVNADNTDNWYYCANHWGTINLEYYETVAN